MTLVLKGTGCVVGKPHGAEGGFDPHSAYKDIDDSNFYNYLCGKILPPSEPSEWVCMFSWIFFCICVCAESDGFFVSLCSFTLVLWKLLEWTRRCVWARQQPFVPGKT